MNWEGLEFYGFSTIRSDLARTVSATWYGDGHPRRKGRQSSRSLPVLPWGAGVRW